MINIFEVFLPQLLRYPNPNDPLNGEAAALLMRHPKEYEAKVKGILTAVFISILQMTNEYFHLRRICPTICDEGSGRCSYRWERWRGRRPGNERYWQHK
jgi:hypothetical protein